MLGNITSKYLLEWLAHSFELSRGKIRDRVKIGGYRIIDL
jgi:hypothetical protein